MFCAKVELVRPVCDIVRRAGLRHGEPLLKRLLSA
jgi:hypothetical protein